MRKNSSSKKTVGVALIIIGLFVGVISFGNIDIPQELSFIKTKISSDGAEVEVGDISESSAVGLGGIATIGLIISGTILALKKQT